MEVMSYLFGAHCICVANSIVRDDEWSCSGEFFEIVCFILSMSDISLQMLDIYLFYSFEVMAKLRGVLATGEKRKY